MKFLLILLVLGMFWQGSLAHVMSLGSCRTFKGVQGFDPEKFAGTWFVIQKLATNSDCMVTNYTNNADDNSLIIQEIRAPAEADPLPVSVSVSIDGTLDMNANDKGKMKLRWNGAAFLSRAISTNYYVVDTDYTSYALDYECQGWGFFKRVSATILSRTKTLDSSILDKLRSTLDTTYDINLTKMQPIEQETCRDLEQYDYNFKVDGHGPSLLGLLGDEKITKLETAEEAEEYLGISDAAAAAGAA